MRSERQRLQVLHPRARRAMPVVRGLATAGLALVLAAWPRPALHAQSAGSPTCSPPAAAEPMRAPDPRVMIGAGAALGVLNLPSIALGPELLAEIDVGWPIDLSVAYFPSNTAQISDHELNLPLHPNFFVPFPEDGSRIRVSMVRASAGTCPLRYRLQSGSLLACGGLFGGVLLAKAAGFVDQSDETRLLLGADAYARWYFRISEPIGITYSAGLFVPFMRERFGYANRQGEFRELFREPPVGGRLDVALTWSFR